MTEQEDGIIDRYVPGYTNPSDGWHFLSSPVANQAIAPNFVSGVNDDVYKWNEPTDTWLNYKVHLWPSMGIGEGFLVAYQTTSTRTFHGVPNASDYPMVNISFTPRSSLSWMASPGQPLSVCTEMERRETGNLTNVQAIAKVLNPGGTYSDLGAGGIIPEANGLMVWVSGTGE